MVKNWAKRTPDNFRFTAKFPKVIAHDKHLVDVNEDVYTFLENMEPDQTLALLIQLPPSMQIFPGLEGLKGLLPYLDDRFRYAVEVRHPSWFQDLAYNFFTDNDICWCGGFDSGEVTSEFKGKLWGFIRPSATNWRYRTASYCHNAAGSKWGHKCPN
jgi:uncharacterized protein YecE (DUF72 family)